MFYSQDLLSIRQKGKLAQCWLAATVNEQIFKQIYKSSSLNKINLYDLCKEIINTIQIKNNELNRRFSLYLSAQLMYGAVKILSYQAINLQNYIFLISKKVLHCSRDKTYVIQTISADSKLCNLTSLIKDYTVVQLNSLPIPQDKFTINNRMEIMMHDATCLDFGALTHEQSNFLHPNEDLTLEEFDRIHDASQNLDKNLSKNLSMVQHKMETSVSSIHNDIALADEETFSKSTLPEITVEEMESGRSNLLASYKRKHIQNINTVTPLKKRCLRFEETANKHQNIISPMSEIEVISTSAIERPFELLQDLESVDKNSVQIGKKLSKKRVFADVNTKLNHRIIKKWLNNIKAHTVLLNVINKNISQSDVLFKTPSTSCTPKHKTIWNKTLNTLFHLHTAVLSRKKVGQTKYDQLLEKSTEFTRFENKSNKNEEIFSELSSALGKSVVLSKNITSEKDITIGMDEFHEVLKVHDITELIIDASATIQFPEISENSCVPETNCTSSKSLSSCLLTKKEFFVLLEIAWQNTDFAAFNDVIAPGHYSKLDAASCFTFLLDHQLQDLKSVPDNSLQIERKSSKKQVFADKNIKLSDAKLTKWVRDVNACTVSLNIINVNILKPEVLFKTPST